MNEALEIRWRELELAKQDFLGTLEGWSGEQLVWHLPDSWSALEVLDHIVQSEVGTFGYIKKKTQAEPEALLAAHDEHRAASQKLNDRLLSNEQYKAPDVLPSPSREKNLQQLITEWDQIRFIGREFVSQLDVAYHDRLVFKHPFAGPINLLQTLEFLTHHITHHSAQLDRIKAQMQAQ